MHCFLILDLVLYIGNVTNSRIKSILHWGCCMPKRLKTLVVFLLLFVDSFCSGTLVAFAKSKKKSIVYVSGMLNSSLHNKNNNGETVWLNFNPLSLIRFMKNYKLLSFDESGLPVNTNIEASTPCKNLDIKGEDDIKIYGVASNDKKIVSMLNDTFGLKTDYDCDIVKYNYDWRKSVRDVSEDLLGLFDEYDSICFVAYSLGCLVVSSAIAKVSGNQEKLSKIQCCIFIAGPFNGSIKVWHMLENGFYTGNRFVDFFIYLLGIKKITEELIRNYPSMYELLPSSLYFEIEPADAKLCQKCDEGYTVVNSFSDMNRYIEASEWYKKSSGEIKDFISKANDTKKEIAEKVKEYLANSGKCFYIYGTGIDTECRLGYSISGNLDVFSMADGDDTVAFLSSCPRGVDGSNVSTVKGVPHNLLVKNDGVIEKVSDILKKFVFRN